MDLPVLFKTNQLCLPSIPKHIIADNSTVQNIYSTNHSIHNTTLYINKFVFCQINLINNMSTHAFLNVAYHLS